MTVEIARRTVTGNALNAALRLIHRDLLWKGPHDLPAWQKAMDWFPHLKHHEDIVALAGQLPPPWREGTLCDPQILLHFPRDPAEPEPTIEYHVDTEPPWAEGRKYARIVGVALTPWRPVNGSLIIPSLSPWRSVLPPRFEYGVRLDVGDAVMMTPDVPHSPGLNRSGEIRYGVYFRWLS